MALGRLEKDLLAGIAFQRQALDANFSTLPFTEALQESGLGENPDLKNTLLRMAVDCIDHTRVREIPGDVHVVLVSSVAGVRTKDYAYEVGS